MALENLEVAKEAVEVGKTGLEVVNKVEEVGFHIPIIAKVAIVAVPTLIGGAIGWFARGKYESKKASKVEHNATEERPDGTEIDGDFFETEPEETQNNG